LEYLAHNLLKNIVTNPHLTKGDGNMKRNIFLPIVIVGLVFLTGCAAKEEATDETSWETPEKTGTYTTAGAAVDASKMQMQAQAAQTKALEEFKTAAQEQQAAATAPMTPATAATTTVANEQPTGENIQKALAAAGLYNGKIDGVIGPMSEQAIKNFQTQKGLTADGKVGPKTWEALKAYLSAGAVSAGAPAAQTAAMPAAEFVKPSTQEVQQALANAGLYSGKIDGLLGPGTEQGIKNFQAQNGLTADGKVGSKTWEKLKPYLTKAVQTTAPTTSAQ